MIALFWVQVIQSEVMKDVPLSQEPFNRDTICQSLSCDGVDYTVL